MPRSQWPLELLDDWTIDEVLDFGVATGLTSVRRLFGRVARRYSRCLGAVLRALAATPGEPRLALLLALLPALLLHRSRDERGGRRLDGSAVVGRIRDFQSGSWAGLFAALRRHSARRAGGRSARVTAPPADAAVRPACAAASVPASADPGDSDATEEYDAHPAAPHWDSAALGAMPLLPGVPAEIRRARQRRTASLISEGEIGRAARVHDASTFAPPTPATAQALRDLHPGDDTPFAGGDAPPLPDGVDAFHLSMLRFARTVRRLPRFSAHGLDLSRFEHVRDLQRHDAGGFAAFFALAQRLVAGGAGCSPALRAVLGAARLVAFAKPAGGVRPIAVGSVWRRVVARAVAAQCRSRWAEGLRPVQFGVGVRGGTEAMVHGVRSLLQEHPDWYVVATDCRNAYNSVSRGGVLRAMQEFDPALLPFVRFFYDEPARLRYAAAAGVARLLSRSGVQQGDPLASVLFSVAIQPALLEIQATAVGDAAGAVVVAQIDDVYLVGPSEWVEASYATLQVAYARIGLQLRHAKGAVYSPLGVPPADADEVHDARGFLVGHRHSRMHVPIVPDGVWYEDLEDRLLPLAGITVVGSAVGSPAFERRAARDVYASSARQLLQLHDALADTQIFSLLARHCVLTRLTYVQRTIVPEHQARAASAFDILMRHAFQVSHHLAPLDDAARMQLALPLRSGGAGWVPSAPALPRCYVASALAAMDALCDVSTGWRRTMLALAEEIAADAAGTLLYPLPPHADALVAAHADLLAAIPAARRTAAGYSAELVGNLGNTAHLQRRLGHADAAHRHQQLRELIATRRIACARELRRASAAVRAASPDAAGDGFDDEVLGRAIHARALAQAGARRWSRRQFTLEAAASWGASDFLAVLPDSTSYSGYTAIAPPMYRVSVAIYLGINLLELDQGTARRCPCDEACRPLDSAIGLDVLLGCNRAGHAFTLSRRHDFWVCTWGAFLSAHGVRAAEEPRLHVARVAPGCKCPDHLVFGDDGRLTGLDVVISHACPPLRHTFGTYGAFLSGVAARKRRQYRHSWPAQAARPRIVPLAASTFGSVAPVTRRYFEAVVHRRGPASFHDVDGIGFQNLHGAQHSLLWRRRLCTALRIAVACTVVARLSVSAPAGVVAPVITAARRSRSFRPVQDLQRRTLAAMHAAPGCRGSGGFDGSGAGGSFGGDECLPGVLGDGCIAPRFTAR